LYICIKARLSESLLFKQKSDIAALDNEVLLSGKLLKKSHNKYKREMQERFVVIKGGKMLYYKKEGDLQEAGFIRLDTSEFCRPYDRSNTCTVFELFDDGRIYTFEASTHAEMNRWLSVVANVRQAVQDRAKERQRLLRESLIPKR
jgi:hypothetical protein